MPSVSHNKIRNAYLLILFIICPVQFREAAMSKDDSELLRVMANYGM
jgi:hypothetical protein